MLQDMPKVGNIESGEYEINCGQFTGTSSKNFDCGIENPDFLYIGVTNSSQNWLCIWANTNILWHSISQQNVYRPLNNGGADATVSISGSIVTISDYISNGSSYDFIAIKKK